MRLLYWSVRKCLGLVFVTRIFFQTPFSMDLIAGYGSGSDEEDTQVTQEPKVVSLSSKLNIVSTAPPVNESLMVSSGIRSRVTWARLEVKSYRWQGIVRYSQTQHTQSCGSLNWALPLPGEWLSLLVRTTSSLDSFKTRPLMTICLSNNTTSSRPLARFRTLLQRTNSFAPLVHTPFLTPPVCTMPSCIPD